MKCLITGASGFLGTACMRRLSPAYEVTGLCFDHAGNDLVRVDLRDRQALGALLERFAPDVVLHCAAYRQPDFCEQEPEEAARLNVEPVAVMARTLPDGARLLFISTDYVFDGEDPPYSEEHPTNPVNSYGRIKAEAEALVLGHARGLVLRIPVLIGAGPGFVAQMVRAVQSDEEQEIDDVIIRFPTWIDDTAEAVAFLLERAVQGIFHYSARRGGTQYAWHCEVARLMGLSHDHLRPSTGMVPRIARRPANSQLSVEKIQALGFSRFTDFSQVFRALYPGSPFL